jgi:hypothetical protein
LGRIFENVMSGGNEVSRIRFNWKPVPWLQPKNIQGIWLYSHLGKLSFELELNPALKLPTEFSEHHPEYSSNKGKSNFTALTDDNLLTQVLANVYDFNVCGAKNKAILIGEQEIEVGGQKKKVLIKTTLRDWKDWVEHRRIG